MDWKNSFPFQILIDNEPSLGPKIWVWSFFFFGKKLTDKTKCIYILIIDYWWQLIIFFLFCTNWHEISVLTIHQSIYDKWNRKFKISFLATLSPCSFLLLNFFSKKQSKNIVFAHGRERDELQNWEKIVHLQDDCSFYIYKHKNLF